MKNWLHLALWVLCIQNAEAQIRKEDKPKLIVGIVVDQMRYDLLMRFQSNFGKAGFQRLLQNGFRAENMKYNYAPTVTGPGHASIYTGTTPAIHGIVGNNWLENGRRKVYCVMDTTAKNVGSEDKRAGALSPRNLYTTTVSDQIKLATNKEAKVIGIALKDRGAILPAGHMADAAYWYDKESGKWITSSYYMDSLPPWVKNVNYSQSITKYMQNGWHLLYSKDKYLAKNDDNVPWEENPFSAENTVLPYTFKAEKYNSDIRFTPFGNSITTDMAISAIKTEKLGRGSTTDFLAISYSSTDYIGHAFGPYSLEIEDCYYRLDQDMERLLKTLDEQTAGQYWVFLTADHGVQDVPDFSIKNNVPGGRLSEDKLAKKVNSILEAKFGGSKPVIGIENEQIYLQNPAMADSAATFLNGLSSEEFEGIAGFYAMEHLASASITKSIREMYIDGYQRNRSGQIAIMLRPNWMTHPGKGTSHSSPYSHDIHVPFLFSGIGVKPSSSSSPYKITDIASTISFLMGILHPNGSTGTPIKELEYLNQKRR